MASLLLVFLFIALPIFGFASGCNIIRSDLTPKEKGLLLQIHNQYRDTTAAGRTPGQPAAANIPMMTWNDGLAKTAQAWANNCMFQHDPHRDFHGGTMGQNLAMIMTPEKKESLDEILGQLMNIWYDEYKIYRFGDPFKVETAHYTQLVWSGTHEVGCGFTLFKEGDWYKYYLVCNYFPQGNMLGQKPYEPGMRSCSKFGLKDSTNFKYLCSH